MEPLSEDVQEKMQEEPTTVFELVMRSGPVMLGLTVLTIFLTHKWIQRKKALADTEEEMDPDARQARMEAIRQAREKQQKAWEEASKLKQEEQLEKERRKRAETLEKLEKYGAAGGQKLGNSDAEYLPLSGGGAPSSYKPPKRSACAKGGCGK